MESYSVKPKYAPCPHYGQKAKRKRVETRRGPHMAVLYRPCWIVAQVGVYAARCQCCKYVQAAVPGVPYWGRYSYEVRKTLANALIRDRMPYHSVIRRMPEEHCLSLSLGYIHDGFVWAHEQIDMESH